MTKINKHIEIVRSTRDGLSSMSQKSSHGILAVLEQHYEKVGISIINDLTDLDKLVDLRPDLVFLGMKFIPVNPKLGQQDSNKIWITDYLDKYEICYTGSNQLAHELELNKHLAKQRALDAGLQTSPFYVAKRDQTQIRDDMPLAFPLFIKPTNRGGGLGIDSYSVAHNFDQLESKVQSITVDVQSDSLVEEYLSGREFSVAILKNGDSDEFWAMPIELIAPADKDGVRVLSLEVKNADSETNREVTDQIIKSKIITLALSIFSALGARDYGRIDIRLNANGTPQFLEANLIPSLIDGYGNFPKACLLNIGMSHESLILNITKLGMLRGKNQELVTI